MTDHHLTFTQTRVLYTIQLSLPGLIQAYTSGKIAFLSDVRDYTHTNVWETHNLAETRTNKRDIILGEIVCDGNWIQQEHVHVKQRE